MERKRNTGSTSPLALDTNLLTQASRKNRSSTFRMAMRRFSESEIRCFIEATKRSKSATAVHFIDFLLIILTDDGGSFAQCLMHATVKLIYFCQFHLTSIQFTLSNFF